MKRTAALLTVLLAASFAPAAESLGDLFAKVKEQVKAEKWTDALVTLEALNVEAAKPENEKYRSQLEAPAAFYRAVCEANVGQADKAQADFETFLRAQPNAGLDEKVYSKKAVAAFQAAQKSIASQGPSLSRAYAEFKAPANAGAELTTASPTWGDGPVKWLMSADEKAGWAAATTDAERTAFVDGFWKARDLEDDHSFRPGFEKRVAFADANFGQDEKRGSLTDRGMVFVLIGPPTYGGRRRLEFQEDTNSNRGQTQVGSFDARVAEQRAQMQGQKTGQKPTAEQMSRIDDSYTGPGKVAADNEMNYQEVWHYRRDLLPKGVSYIQVDAVFVTKKGYGKNVLQRDPDILTTLDAAKQKPQ